MLEASLSGLVASFLVVGLLRPALPPPWRWLRQGIALHAALWLLLHAALVIVLGRPWFAMAVGLALLMLVVQVSNAKHYSLREAFVFQDFEYFTDAIRHPRLYIPFLGWWKFALIAVALLAALAIGLGLEAAPAGRFAWQMLLVEAGATGLAAGLLIAAVRGGGRPIFTPDLDMRRFGLLACLWHYGWAERKALQLPSMLSRAPDGEAELADIVVVQSESFFDPRPLFPGIKVDLLLEFDRIREQSLAYGRLAVPAWGANTVRSEFAFLSGAGEAALGVHRFNPYRQILQGEVTTLAHLLKAAGYRTVCIHPYPASFYGRDRVFPHLGFDEFIDIRAFSDAERFGPYISDLAVAEQIRALLDGASEPLFVFAITMENHGPLHLETPSGDDCARCYDMPPPSGCEDLTVYLRHLKNADRMIGELRQYLLHRRRPAKLCWYGDHVPIMASVYRALGDPDGQTEYFVWDNRQNRPPARAAISLDGLAALLLGVAASATVTREGFAEQSAAGSPGDTCRGA